MKYTSYGLLIIILSTTIGCFYVGSILYNNTIVEEKTALERLKKEISKGADALDIKISSIYTIDQEVARIAISKPSIENIESTLNEIMSKNKILTSCGIVYAPYMYSANEKLLSRRIVRMGEELLVYSMESKEDYTNTEWYRRAQSGKSFWSDPFLDEISKELIVRYSVPFFLENPSTHEQEFAGVNNVAISVYELNNFVMEISLEKKTYAMLIHENGTILAHPSDELLSQEKKLSDLARQPGKKSLLVLYNELKKRDEGELILDHYQKNKSFHVVFQKIPMTPWFLILMRLQDGNFIYSHEMRQLVTMLLLLIILFLIAVFSFVCLFCCSGIRAAWLTSSCCAFLLLIAIAFIWALDITSNIPNKNYLNVVDTELSLDRFFFLQRKTNPLIYKKQAHMIPTGIFLTSFDVGSDSDININGYVWQKYDRTKNITEEPGVVIFNAIDQSFEKIYTATKNSIETIGWRFRATFKENFNYLKYPFDEQEVIISLGHKDYLANTILIPDFDAFSLSETLKPEIDPNTSTGQWIVKQTSSFYQLTDFATNFGIQGYNRQKGFPNLAFAVSIRRKFVYPLTASALPVSIILVVVFSIVLFTGLTKSRMFLPTDIIKLTSSIFFGAAVAHQTFQRTLQSPVITYFEYFYFLIYIIILLTAVNGMLYGYNRGGVLISAYNNLIPRLFYWPITLLLSLLLTLYFFY